MGCSSSFSRHLLRRNLQRLLMVMGVWGLLSDVHAGLPEGEFAVSMGHAFTRSAGQPQNVTVSFSAPIEGGYYSVRLYNGKYGDPATSADVVLNGNTLFSSKDFKKSVSYLERTVNLSGSNTLTVSLKGKPGSGFEIDVVGLDGQKPTIQAYVEPQANEAGWHHGETQVWFECNDAISGVAECSEPVIVNEEVTDFVVEGQAVDHAGNVESTQITINLDKTKPVAETTIAPLANEQSWHNVPATVSYTCSDNLSGVVECPQPDQVLIEGSEQTITQTIFDRAGNTTFLNTLLNLDFTAPSIRSHTTPSPNEAGWVKTPATVSFECSDALSGIALCQSPIFVSSEGVAQSITGQVSDQAGNQTNHATIVNLDMTAPVLDIHIFPEANANGWHNQLVTVSYSCSDALSGVIECPAELSLDEEGASQEVSASISDYAGNNTVATSTLNLDTTLPTIESLRQPQPNEAGWNNTPVTLTYECADALSGVEACSDLVIVDFELIDVIYTGEVSDLSGNTASITDNLRIDLTPPSIQAVFSRQPNEHGWYDGPVEIEFLCEDFGSGIAVCHDPVTLSDNGADQVVIAKATDIAGNETEYSLQLHIDQTPPIASFILPVDKFYVADVRPDVQLVLFDDLALNENSVQLTVNGIEGGQCEVNDGLARCQLSTDLPAGEVRLGAKVSDLAGNHSEVFIQVALDSDRDGLPDDQDQCADTVASTKVDEYGCAEPQLDSDGDGVVNADDQCPNTLSGILVNTVGCDLDNDGDGISDSAELQAGTNPNDPDDFPPLKISQFIVEPAQVTDQDQQVTISWDVQGARTIRLSNDASSEVQALGSKGSLTVNPKVSTRYRLKAVSATEELEQVHQVEVNLPAPPVLWPTSVALDRLENKVSTSLTMSKDGSSYIGSFDNNYYKISPNGTLEWVFEDAGRVIHPALFDGNELIISADVSGAHGDQRGQVYRLSENKEVLWQQPTNEPIVAGLVFNTDKSVIFAVSYNGELNALNSRTGDIIWRYTLPDGVRVTEPPVHIAENESLMIKTLKGSLLSVAVSNAIPDEVDRLIWFKSLSDEALDSGIEQQKNTDVE